MVGGAVWNAACTLLGKGISMMGQAIDFPLCTGTGLIPGSIIAYLMNPGNTKVGMLSLGNFFALCGICTAGLVARMKQEEVKAGADENTTEVDSEQKIEIIIPETHVPSLGKK